ncbi:MAG TPA: hypothetical protein VM308_05410 [Sphingomicrobium sp.]|nr:hypothetical protein [Sphingomicrobium sp.]
MSWSGPGFVLAIIAISTLGWLVSTWIRAKHGYPIENEWSGTAEKRDAAAERQIAQLSEENSALKTQVKRLEDRLAVLERIATDQPDRLSREIEQLR